ncbi:pyruvate kinase [Desulfosoma caldarium]|uniref:Pyruvate kinase n=1 Tax=Desulfosoma caldarium TaxID=610254 RepID=A0A3N1UQR8_9BACT|nr:pyruvate kinase [Desulfosoma caldarium]ROQ92088.1 pyruvate kinase [Desulfosoma caldarium]
MMRQRRTKIVCTIGPASQSKDVLRELVRAGMDVARINLSHGDHESHALTIRALRDVAAEEGKDIGILQDLGGPKIRLGQVPEGERVLAVGEVVRLIPGQIGSGADLAVQYPYLLEDVAVGERILLADGLVELQVTAKDRDALQCRVVVGGVIHSHKGVNLPSSSLRIPSFTEKDRQDLLFGLEHGVDFVGLSFIRHERDVAPVREMLQTVDPKPMVIAKIEKPQALDRLDAILDSVDGVMVARGDLGVETPLYEVPVIQKKIIQAARDRAKPVITATQMLRSMISSPRPTRAETTDVANAVLDGTDAVMLSEETAMGSYPVEAVRMLDRIAVTAEKYMFDTTHHIGLTSAALPGMSAAISEAVLSLANALPTAAIIASTASGQTARLVSRLRPRTPIVGFTHAPATVRQLCLSWGVYPVLVPRCDDTDTLFAMARQWAMDHGVARRGDVLVLTAGVPVGQSGTTNMVKVIEL